jgi:hypothetical protein
MFRPYHVQFIKWLSVVDEKQAKCNYFELQFILQKLYFRKFTNITGFELILKNNGLPSSNCSICFAMELGDNSDFGWRSIISSTFINFELAFNGILKPVARWLLLDATAL